MNPLLEQGIVVLLSFLVFFGLFLYCHVVLRFQGTAASSANNIRYRYLQMLVVLVLLAVGFYWGKPETFWVEASAALAASAVYYAGRFGVLQFFSLIAMVGVMSWSVALGANWDVPVMASLLGVWVSFVVDMIWNRELKRRNLPP